MALRVRLLGGLAVDGVDLARLGSRKGRRVLARLALARGGAVNADTLADVVWGDEQPSHPGDQLSVLVSRLRSALGPQRLTRTSAGYALAADWVDIVALGELVAEARRRLTAGTVAPAMAAARAALDLIRGPLLPEEGSDAGWLEAERVVTARLATQSRMLYAEASLAAGDPWTAAVMAEAALAAEPFDEPAVTMLMQAHARSRRPALALRVYAEFAQRLADELGVDPAPDLQALHLDLLRGPAAPPPAATRPPPRLPGRSAEVAALRAAVERAAGGEAQLVVIDGEPGIGKTRLLDEFAAILPSEAAVTVLRCRGDEMAGGLPLQPLLDAVAAHVRTAADGSELLAGAAAPLWGLLAGGADPSGSAVALLGLNPEQGLGVLFGAYDEVITRLARSGPVVFMIDDVQWADAASRAWLHHAVRRLAGVRVCVVAASRSGEGDPVRGGETIRLGPLDAAAAAEALGLAVGSDRARWLYDRSGGHPLFLLELARAAPGAPSVPASLRDSVLDRCQRAGPGVAATLRAAAVLGPDIDLDLLAAVLAEPVAVLLDHLEEGVRRHLLAEDAHGLHFAHQLVREALRSATGVARSALLHREAARCLQARADASTFRSGASPAGSGPSLLGSGADPLTVAMHARLGGDHSMAATALSRAAEIAADRYDLAEAARLIDEAVALDGRTDLLVRRARLRFRVSDNAGGSADTRRVREQVGRDHPDYVQALELEALIAYDERDFTRSRRLAEEGAQIAADPELRASCLAIAGRVRHAVGDLAGARERLDQTTEIAPASLAPVVDLWRAFLLVHTGEPVPALRLVAQEPAHARVGYPFTAISRHMVAGYAQALRGEPAAALREFDLMTAAAAREQTERFAARDDNFRAWVLRGVGAVGAADDANAAGYERARALSLAEPMAHALLDLADGRLRAGDPDGAAAHLATLRAAGDEEFLFRWRTLLRTDLVTGRWALAMGRPEDAASLFERVLAEARRLELPRYRVQARLWGAMARHRAGEPVRPQSITADVRALDRVAPLEAWWLTGELARTLGVPRWSVLARERAAVLAARAGAHGATLRPFT